ncbi:MAG: AbrB/MazE/SpoVT family DNA-binding domain-containing protein [Acidobacteriota bacterium]|nr:MAG: AbrB/MazE/SpoVT family DNA-binding domain-containing protein [Acidobacteriota bacterium]
MPLVKVSRSAQITLPAEVRKPLDIEEGDYLSVESVEGGILLKPVVVMDKEEAWKRLFALLDQIPRGKTRKKFRDAREEEEAIAEMIKEFRKQNRDQSRS